MNLQGEPRGEKCVLRFGQRAGLTPFVLIKTAAAYLMAAGSQGLGFLSDLGDSSAV